MYRAETENYFSNKAEKYDLVEHQSYWNLSDKILWKLFTDRVINNLDDEFRFFDAGGGTGRWSYKILNEFPFSRGTTVDASSDMLKQAELKRKNSNLCEEKWNIVKHDLHDLSKFYDNEFDVVFNFHNVLGFVENPEKVFSEMVKITKQNKYLVSFVPNKYHAAWFNIYRNKLSDAIKSIKGKGRFTDDMPNINLFDFNDMQDLSQRNGIEIIMACGFPALIYPGIKETGLHGETRSIADLLASKENYESIYHLELSLIDNNARDLIHRGNNLFFIMRKK